MEKDASVEQIQNCCLKMLSFFDTYARENNITYYLSGGTLLGAIRHNGFIPWDDDVDLMLPRKDYEKLINSFSDERYCISCCELDADYKVPFARLWDTSTIITWELINEKKIGVFIDLFPIDGFPTSSILTLIHLLRIRYNRILSNLSMRTKFYEGEKYKLLKKFIIPFIRKNGNYYSNHINNISKKYEYLKCKFVGVKGSGDHLFKEKNDKGIFQETLWVPFEDLVLPAPVGYDDYLKQLYGNYMQLPPEQSRISSHSFTIKFLDNYS